MFSIDEIKQKYQNPSNVLETTSSTATSSTTPAVRTRQSVEQVPTSATPEKKPFQSRFLAPKPEPIPAPTTTKPTVTEPESSSEEETTTDESEEEEEEEEEEVKPTPSTKTTTSSSSTPLSSSRTESAAATRVREAAEARRNSRDENHTSSPSRTSYSSPTYKNSFDRDDSPKYGTSSSTSVRSRPTSSHTEVDDNRYGGAGSSGSG